MKGSRTIDNIPVMVNVTQKDIDCGIPNWCTKCPIAQALQRSVGYGSKVIVDRHSAVVKTKGNVWRATLPPDGCDFINKFDSGVVLNPIILELSFSHREGEL